tara:strand:+ start:1152 stop:1490 length:339 start_codon:yes stop_codon:yes gene_type:complete
MRRTGIGDALEKFLAEKGEKKYQEICFGMPEWSPGNISGALTTLLRERRISKGGAKKNQSYKIREHTEEVPTGLKKYVPPIRTLARSGLTSNWDLCMRSPYDPKRDSVRLVR